MIPVAQYKLGTTCLAWAENTKYLEVTIQSDLAFDLHIAKKSIKSNKILDGIKHLMHNAPQEAKLLAYTSLCRPILEYADVVWDPSVKSTVHNIELIQNKAIRFIANLRGRDDSVSVTRKRLKLEGLEERRKNHRLCLLTKILQAEEQHNTLLKDYEEAMGNRQPETMTTRAATRGEPRSISTSKMLTTVASCHGPFVT